MTLKDLKPGERAYITSITHSDHTIRPVTLGLIEGTLVECLTRHFHSTELGFYGNRMAMSDHTAKRYGCKKVDN